MSYQRLKEALMQIASGAADPVAIANEALRDRRPVAKPELPEPPPKRLKFDHVAYFGEWVAAGRPSCSQFGRATGRSETSARYNLCKAMWILKHYRHKNHPLRFAAIQGFERDAYRAD